jgi:uncharacterized protein
VKIFFSPTQLAYTGAELSPHFLYKHFGLEQDALVAFIGPAEVGIDHMVDLEDVKNNAPIYSPRMVHFLAEWFIDSLDQGILLQHLFVDEIYHWMWENLSQRRPLGLSKRGNDLFYESRKLSVSIATRSPVSVLMHTAVNVHTEGTPVPTAGLAELGVDPMQFAPQILERFQSNWFYYKKARSKVMPRV